MASLIGWVCLTLGAACVLGYLVTWVRSKFPAGATPPAVITAADRVLAYADEAVAGAALGTVAVLFKVHGDTEAVMIIGQLWGKAMAWPTEAGK